jgi:polyketide biosynthesis enoyl-CoA hydratase PksI
MNATIRHRGGGVWSFDAGGSLGVDDIPRMRDALADLPKDARCVVLTGGRDVFNSGATRAGLIDCEQPITEYVGEIPRLLVGMPVPTVAAMAGHAVGGGLLLGLWCEVAVLAEDRLYGANFMSLGFTPGMGATTALESAFGAMLAREMLYTGKLLTGAELRRRGAPLPYVMPRAAVEERAFELAAEIAAVPPESVRLLHRTFAARRSTQLEAALGDEGRMHREVFSDPAARARIAELLPEE